MIEQFENLNDLLKGKPKKLKNDKVSGLFPIEECNARDHEAIATLRGEGNDGNVKILEIIEFNGCYKCDTCNFIETSLLDRSYIEGAVEGTHEYMVGFTSNEEGPGHQVCLDLI